MNVINKFINRYWFVLKQIWNITFSPEKTLKENSIIDVFKGKSILRCAVLPMVELLVFIGFITGLFVQGKISVSNAVIQSLFSGLTFILSYGIFLILIKNINITFFKIFLETRKLEIIIISLMTVTFVVILFKLLFPHMFFISFYYVYLFYLVWLFTETIISVDEKKRNRYIVIISIIVSFIPWIIKTILRFMVPNL